MLPKIYPAKSALVSEDTHQRAIATERANACRSASTSKTSAVKLLGVCAIFQRAEKCLSAEELAEAQKLAFASPSLQL